MEMDQDMVTLERSVYTQLLSEMAAMKTGLLQLQALLQQEPAVAGVEEDRGGEEVEEEGVDGDEDDVEGGIFDYESDSETQVPPSTHDASTQAAACLQDAATEATATCLDAAIQATAPALQDASTQTDGAEPAAGRLDGLRRLFRRVFTPRRRTTPKKPAEVAQPVREFGGNFQSYTTRSVFVTILNWFAASGVLNTAKGPKIYRNSYWDT